MHCTKGYLLASPHPRQPARGRASGARSGGFRARFAFGGADGTPNPHGRGPARGSTRGKPH